MKTLLIGILILLLGAAATEAQIKVDVDNNGLIKSIIGLKGKALEVSNCIFITGVKAKLKKIEYESDELTIKGLVFEEKEGKRYFVVFDAQELKSLPAAYRNNLYTFLEKDVWFKIDYNACGSEGSYYLVNIRKNKKKSENEFLSYYYPSSYFTFRGFYFPYPFYSGHSHHYYPFKGRHRYGSHWWYGSHKEHGSHKGHDSHNGHDSHKGGH